MTQTPAGWYRDPSGLPDAYRWWDGSQWTTSLTTNPDAPEPTSQEPARPPTPPQEQPHEQPREQPFTRPAGQPSVPPPPGAPGPGYVPPPPWAAQRTGQPTDVLDVAPASMTNRRKAVIAAIAVVCVALLGAGGYFMLTNSGRTPAASPTPPQVGEQTPDPEGPPSAEPEPEPEPEPSSPPPDAPRLTYTPPGGKWQDNPDAADAFPFGMGQSIVTEENYEGQQDWVAVVSAGYSQPGWYVDGDLAGSAKRIATWFATSNFAGFEVGRRQVSGKAVKVDGLDAYELEEEFTYAIPNLKAKSEAVTIVVVDLGLNEAGGVFLASLPDTNKATDAAAVQKVRDSLRVEE
jgi:Protein of unknown function (DUF2510)